MGAERPVQSEYEVIRRLLTTSPVVLCAGTIPEVDHDQLVAADEQALSYLSPNVQQFLGLHAANLEQLRAQLSERIHPDDVAAHRRAEADAFGSRPVHLTASFRMKGEGEVYRRVRTLLDEDPEHPGLLQGYVFDEFDQGRAEDELREHEALLQQIVDNAGSTIFVKDLAGRFLLVNASLARVLGRSATSLLGDAFPPEDGSVDPDIDDEVVASGRRVAFDLTRAVDGMPRHFLGVKFPLRDTHGNINAIGTIYTDVTERKQAQLDAEEAHAQADDARIQAEEARRQAEQARDRALAASQEKTAFLSRMSHELRTPLNSIIGFGQLLEQRELAAEEQEWVGHVVRAGQHLLDLIDEVLDLTRVGPGQKAVRLPPVDLHDLVVTTIGLVQPAAAARSISIVAQARDGRAVWALADRPRTVQILLNPLTNAILYNFEAGTVEVTARSADRDRVELAVHDRGPGIHADLLGRAFEPFDRLGAEHRGVEGTGMGLALSRGLAEEMGGSLTVTSTPGAGTTFTLSLPAASEPVRSAPATREATPATVSSPPITVLYIEDDVANVQLMERVLQRRPSIAMLTAMRGRIGLDIASREQPDVIMVDLHLPDIDGYQVVRLLRRNPTTATIPIVVVSAYASPARRAELLIEGVKEHLTKPIDIDHVLDVIERVVNGASARP